MLPWRLPRVLVAVASGVGSFVLTTFLLLRAANGTPVQAGSALVLWIGICNLAFLAAGVTVWRDEHKRALSLASDASRILADDLDHLSKEILAFSQAETAR